MNKYKYLETLTLMVSILFISNLASGAETLGPVDVSIVNNCSQHSIGILAGGEKQDTQIGEKFKYIQLPGRASHDYRIVTCTEKSCYMHGVISMRPGSKYTVEVSNCAGAGADVSVIESLVSNVEFKKSLVRFRSARMPARTTDSPFVKILEYRPIIDGFSIYRKLGLGFTSYKPVLKDAQPKIEARIRMGKGGPIIQKRSISVKMVNNRKYLVEISYKEKQLFFKVIDEGWID